MPSVQDLVLLCMIGFLGGFANLWLSQSFKLSEVSLVSPLKYLASSLWNSFWIFNLG